MTREKTARFFGGLSFQDGDIGSSGKDLALGPN
jgi:hypothetical protein